MTELLSLPLVGITSFVCTSEMFAFAFLIVYAIRRGELSALAWAVIVGLGSLLTVALELLRSAAGDFWSTQAMVLTLVVGIYSMVWARSALQRDDAWRLPAFAVLGFLAMQVADGLAMLADLSHHSLSCTHGSCNWFFTMLRWTMWLFVGLLALFAFTFATASLVIPFLKVLERARQWDIWGSTAGVALFISQVPVAAISRFCNVFEHAGAWCILSLAMMLSLALLIYPVQQVVVPGVFPGVMSPHLAMVPLAWAGRLVLELALHVSSTLPDKFLLSFQIAIHVLAGLAAGSLVAKRIHIQRLRLLVIVRSAVLLLKIAAGVALHIYSCMPSVL
jgi:hypothetical protein